MSQIQIDLDLLQEQKKALRDYVWGMPEGSNISQTMEGIAELLDEIHDRLRKSESVELVKTDI